jgi:hypothetical protein
LGAIEWNQQIDAFICRAPKEQRNATLNIDLAFDAIEEALSFFADGAYSVERPPASDTWSDALIEFLRSESGENLVNSSDKAARSAQKIKKVKETLVAGQNFERFIAARFIQEYENDNEIFSKALHGFTGVLIEDFLSNIQTLPENANYAAVSIYYDTGVLLRLLGTSGAVLQNTTMEMHNALRGLKCRTVYLPNTRGEVDEILNNFLKKRAAGEIHPETAEALANGDLKESDVVELSGTYSVRLEHMGIRLSKLASQTKGQEYQINVSELAGALVAEAVSRRRSYLKKSAENDARAIATILRLRAGHVTGALSESRHVFVTRNPLLQAVTRQYALDNIEYYFQGAIPLVLTVEQVATVAWLASSNKMEPIKVTRELLANCYNAARPSANWTKEFQSILDTYMSKDPRTAQQLANSAIFLHTARNMALDATIGQASLLKKLRIQDLLNAAAIRDREREEAYRNELDRLRSKAEREKAAADETKSKLDEAERRAKDAESNRQMAEEARSAADRTFVVVLKEAEREFIRQTSEQRRQWIAEQQNKNATQLVSTSVARGIRLTIQVAFVAAFTALAVLISLDFWQKDTWWYFSMLGLHGCGGTPRKCTPYRGGGRGGSNAARGAGPSPQARRYFLQNFSRSA